MSKKEKMYNVTVVDPLKDYRSCSRNYYDFEPYKIGMHIFIVFFVVFYFYIFLLCKLTKYRKAKRTKVKNLRAPIHPTPLFALYDPTNLYYSDNSIR